MYANYSQIPVLVAERREFDGNSSRGVFVHDGNTTQYRVYSYGTEIARVNEGGEYLLNVTKYSRTTSRLQGIVRRVWADKVIELDAGSYRIW